MMTDTPESVTLVPIDDIITRTGLSEKYVETSPSCWKKAKSV